MLRRLFLLLALSAQPALAIDYAIFYPGADRPSEFRANAQEAPVPGVDCPEGSKVRVFAALEDENGKKDPDYRNYILTTAGLRRVIEQPVVDTKPVPNTQGFYEALAASDVVTDEEFAQALRCQYVKDPAERDAKILKYASGLSPEKLQVLLEAAQKNNIALPLGR